MTIELVPDVLLVAAVSFLFGLSVGSRTAAREHREYCDCSPCTKWRSECAKKAADLAMTAEKKTAVKE